jgi:hypothetical protein
MSSVLLITSSVHFTSYFVRIVPTKLVISTEFVIRRGQGDPGRKARPRPGARTAPTPARRHRDVALLAPAITWTGVYSAT